MPRHNPTSRSIQASFTIQTVGWLQDRRRASNNPKPTSLLPSDTSFEQVLFFPPFSLFPSSPYLSPPLLLLFFSFSQIWIRFSPSHSSPLLLSRSLVGKSELRVYTLLVRSISTNPSFSPSPPLSLSLSLPYLLSPPASRRQSSEGCQLPWG